MRSCSVRPSTRSFSKPQACIISLENMEQKVPANGNILLQKHCFPGSLPERLSGLGEFTAKQRDLYLFFKEEVKHQSKPKHEKDEHNHDLEDRFGHLNVH